GRRRREDEGRLEFRMDAGGATGELDEYVLGETVQRDEPVSFDPQHRQYGWRTVLHGWLPVPGADAPPSSAPPEHDALGGVWVFISRIQLNPRRRDAWRLLGSPQRMQAAVLASFVDPPVGDREGEPRVLWRLDQEKERCFLYVVSPDEPDFAHLAEQAGWPTTERGTSRPYGAFLARLAPGQQWAFRLTAN